MRSLGAVAVAIGFGMCGMSEEGTTPNSLGMTKALGNFAAMLEPVNDAVDGYRTSLLRRGYNETAAEQMTVEYHRCLLHMIFFQKVV